MYCVTITDAHLDTLQWVSLIYYLRESNRENGLVADKTMPGSPASIAAVGFSLATAPVVVERDIVDREEAAQIVLKKLKFFRDSPQGPEPDATGYKGFYYHFLDMKSGRRVWNCEISTVDTGFLIAGVLTVASYFDPRRPGRESDPRDRRIPLPARRLAMGDQRRGRDHPRLEARDRLHPPLLRRLRRRVAALRPGARIADLLAGPRELQGLDVNIPVETGRRMGVSLLRAAVHASALAPVHRLQGHPRRVHAVARHRLLRELAPGHLHPARIRDQEPARVRHVRRDLLGLHRLRRPRMFGEVRSREGSEVLRLPRSRKAPRSGRTTAPSPPGWWWPRCRSPPRSSCRRSRISTPSTSG